MRRPVTVMAGFALTLGLVGCSAQVEVGTGDTTASASPTVAADTTTYTSAQYGFSFEYAAPFEEQDETIWQAQTSDATDASVAVFDTSGSQVAGQYRDAFVVNVYELDTEITEANLSQVATDLEQNVIPQLEQSAQDMQIGDLVATEVNGLKGFQADATFSVEGTPMTSTLYFLFDGATEYQLLTQSTAERAQELQPAFDAMVDSFTVESQTASE